MIIDCEGCTARPAACGDCVVTFVLEAPRRHPAPRASSTGTAGAAPVLELDADEHRALDALAALRMVPPLRLVPAEPDQTTSCPAPS